MHLISNYIQPTLPTDITKLQSIENAFKNLFFKFASCLCSEARIHKHKITYVTTIYTTQMMMDKQWVKNRCI